MKALAARRRHPAAIVVLLLLGLLVTGGAYSMLAPKAASAAAASADTVAQGQKLFLANCATCHGINAQGGSAGPSLVGVGAAAVDFQVGTGRMPLPQPAVQAQRLPKVQFNQDQISALGAYVASLGPGPGVPGDQYTTPLQPGTAANNERIGRGGQLFRVNCAMCHNFAGSGGALTRGKFAPSLDGVAPKHIYEAMVTGPQSMPVFNDGNLDPSSKQDIISYLKSVNNETAYGGMTLGKFGPVPEGLFAWLFGLGILIGCAVWLGKKAA